MAFLAPCVRPSSKPLIASLLLSSNDAREQVLVLCRRVPAWCILLDLEIGQFFKFRSEVAFPDGIAAIQASIEEFQRSA
jgi:hypothetical protein